MHDVTNEFHVTNSIQKGYEISPFHGLRKPHPHDKLIEDRPVDEPTEDPKDTTISTTEENEDQTVR